MSLVAPLRLSPPIKAKSRRDIGFALGIVFIMAVLIALPIPFGNVLPGLAVLAIALGLAQRDDVAVLAGLVLAVLSVLTSVALIYGGWALISGWLGMGQPAV